MLQGEKCKTAAGTKRTCVLLASWTGVSSGQKLTLTTWEFQPRHFAAFNHSMGFNLT